MEKLQVVGFFETLRTGVDGIQYIEKSSSRLFSILVLPLSLLFTWGVIDRTFSQFGDNTLSWEVVFVYLMGGLLYEV